MLTPLNSWFAKETLALDDWPKDGALRAPHLWANCAPRQSEQTLGSWCCRSRDGQGCGKRPPGRQCTVASFPLPLLQVSRWFVSSWVITLSYRSLLQSCYKLGVLGVKKKTKWSYDPLQTEQPLSEMLGTKVSSLCFFKSWNPHMKSLPRWVPSLNTNSIVYHKYL